MLAATTGPDGQAALGDSVAAGQPGGELVGWVTFSSLKDYGSAAQFNADVARHCVTADSPYAWREGVTQRLFGWEVGSTGVLQEPAPLPTMRRVQPSLYMLESPHS